VFDHVTVRASMGEASMRFYETVLPVLGIEETHRDEWFVEWDDFGVAGAGQEHPVTRGLHVAFVAPSREHVDEFWRVGTEAGYREDGAPGERPQYRDDYYGAFLLDPDGNSVEAVHHGAMRRDGKVDHLWIRVADVATSRAFYEAIAPHAGFALKHAELHDPYRAHFAASSGSFSVVAGEPTTHLHMAFPAAENATVDAFHAAALAAGAVDNGAPGERPVYHPGYYGAFAFDPDGNNVEVVCHNRP
jgi:catechol 2,3-dioxygenase-like lactoylglutathione lyase family enzyme